MVELALQMLAVAVALAVAFALLHAAFKQRFQFMITLDGGQPRVTKGKVHADLLANIRAVCGEYKIAAGWIGGVRQGKQVALRFSRNIPPACQQRLRNIWFGL